MSPKFNNPRTNPRRTPTSPIVTESRPSGYTAGGGVGYARDAKSELFLLAVANMVSENTFYESGADRDTRFEQLIHQVAPEDPAWITQFLGWLRGEANMRSAALVGGLEAARALVTANRAGGRQIVSSVLQRADEPGEAIAYWRSRYDRKTIPMPIKRGIGDAALRLYNEYSLLKYDTASHPVRFGDVIELVRPGDAKKAGQRFTGSRQEALFTYAIERRHKRENPIPSSLSMIRKNEWLRAVGDENDWLDPETLKAAGMTWEDVLSAGGPSANKAKLWEALIPTMGYMALLRNLRNFDEAGVSADVAVQVVKRLRDPEQVARSKQFPFRFLSAYRSVSSVRWSAALEEALQHSLANIPQLRGRTLVLVDRSGSMWGPLSSKSLLNRADAAAVFGAALALRNAGSVDLVEFGSTSRVVPHKQGDSLLRVANERFHNLGGTNTSEAVRMHYAGQDRVVIVTDEQAYWHTAGDPAQQIPPNVPLYTWNLAGYKYGQNASGQANRHTFGGLTDQAFRMIPLLEAGTSAGWPWEQGAR